MAARTHTLIIPVAANGLAATRRAAHALATIAVLSGAPVVCAFGATDLMSAFHLALEQDPTYLSAGSANRAAQEVRPQARAALLPRASASASTTGTEIDVRRFPSGDPRRPSFNTDVLDLTIVQPVYRKDFLIALGQADTEIRRADLDYAAARQDLMLRIATRYFAVLQAIDELSFAQAALEAFGQQLKQSQQRFEVGLIAITDVEEAQAGFDRARAEVLSAENSLDNSRESIREVTGEYPQELALLSEEMPLSTPEPDDIDVWTEIALRQNLPLAAARQISETSRDEIKRVQAGHLPTVDLVANHQRSNAGGGTTGATDLRTNSVSVQLSLPIYQGGLVLSRTRASRHRYQQTLDEVERARRSAQRQTRDSFLDVKSGISQVGALAQAVRSALSAKEAIEAGFQVGTRTSVDVLNADRNVFQAKRDHAVARYSYILNVLRLKQAAGTLSEEDLDRINGWLR